MVIFYSYVNAYQRVDCIPQRDGHDMTGKKQTINQMMDSGGFPVVMGVPPARWLVYFMETPKHKLDDNPNSWMVYFMENPNKKLDDDWGYPMT